MLYISILLSYIVIDIQETIIEYIFLQILLNFDEMRNDKRRLQ